MHPITADIVNALNKIAMLPPDFEPRLKIKKWLQVKRAPCDKADMLSLLCFFRVVRAYGGLLQVRAYIVLLQVLTAMYICKCMATVYFGTKAGLQSQRLNLTTRAVSLAMLHPFPRLEKARSLTTMNVLLSYSGSLRATEEHDSYLARLAFMNLKQEFSL